MAEPKELRSLTGLRGVAALYVVLFHFGRQTFSSPKANFVAHGYLAVDLFFVLSGFVMAMNYVHMFDPGWSMGAYFKFLGRRIARVYPLYLACCVVSFALMVAGIFPRLVGCHSLTRTFWLNVFMMQNWGLGGCGSLDPPGWSISAEWAAYLLFPVLLVPALLRRAWSGWMSGLICVLTLLTLCLLPDSIRRSTDTGKLLDFTNQAYGLAVVRCLAEFVLGLLSYRVVDARFSKALGASAWFSPILCCAIVALLTVQGTDFLVVLLFPLLIVSLASGTNWPKRILSTGPAEFLGVLSYSIYLIHRLVESVQTQALMRLVAWDVAHPHFWSDVTLGVVLIATSMAAHRLIEVPCRRWLRNVFEPRKHVSVPVDRITTRSM